MKHFAIRVGKTDAKSEMDRLFEESRKSKPFPENKFIYEVTIHKTRKSLQ